MFKKLIAKIELRIRARFVRLQGEGAKHQSDVYRCRNCKRLITWNIIREGRACCQGMMSPTDPSLREKVRLLTWKI